MLAYMLDVKLMHRSAARLDKFLNGLEPATRPESLGQPAVIQHETTAYGRGAGAAYPSQLDQQQHPASAAQGIGAVQSDSGSSEAAADSSEEEADSSGVEDTWSEGDNDPSLDYTGHPQCQNQRRRQGQHYHQNQRHHRRRHHYQ
ncbi:hypothetical protein GQ42DRAFT_77817 [Ramicandelaber brevisporus]|nr:hypothetical protein GQ42DRAFT_77817 [Ramicandelaber brevisporus]